jgi:hypothetical protein
LGQKHRAKTVTGWLGAACVLAFCICIVQGKAAAQNADSSNANSAGSKTVATKPVTTKTANSNHQIKSATAPKTSSSTAKASPATHHPATHTASGKPRKSSAVAANSKTASSRKNSKRKATARGQQKIDSERAEAIQEALIREHYLTGEPTGTWNQSSEDAMRRYQADHGWQSKQVPDSRALISLGLGPSKDHLLNPDSAMSTGPDVSHTATATSSTQSPVAHSADPGVRMSLNPATPADPAPTASSDHDAPDPQ